MKVSFDSNVIALRTFKSDWTDKEIKAEPQLFNCDLLNAYNLGGPITKAFLDAMPEEWHKQQLVVDSRTHMLMPGWFPCIPGWHHDDVPRTMANGQPNYNSPHYRSRHLMGLVNAQVCPTEFAIGNIRLDLPEEGVYRTWHPLVEDAVRNGQLNLYRARSGLMYEFDWQTFHQGTRARENGWRWFIRVSKNTDRVSNCTNEVRTQTQVYMEFPMEGW